MLETEVYGMWYLVAINAGLFIFFALSFFKPKKRWEWRSLGVFSGFIVALFTEMFGFPLTIYLLTSALGSRYPVIDPFNHINSHLWVALSGGSAFVWALVMVVSNVAIWGGLAVIVISWRQIHKAEGELVNSGLYGRVRHPQYSALFLITVGMLIQWPTIITLIMWPVLMYMYYRLAHREEKEMESHFGDRYIAYKQQTAMFLPRLASASYTADA